MLVLLPILTQAQEPKSDLETYFGDTSPALLFQVTPFSLIPMLGGIGVLVSASPAFHIPVVFSPEFDREQTARVREETYNQTITSVNFGITVSPYWILTTDGNFCFTAGPLLGYTVSYWSGESDAVFGENGHKNQGLQVGLTAGTGYAITKDFFLHAEYRLTGERWYLTYRYPGSTSIIEQMYWSDWHLQSKGVLTLGVRL